MCFRPLTHGRSYLHEHGDIGQDVGNYAVRQCQRQLSLRVQISRLHNGNVFNKQNCGCVAPGTHEPLERHAIHEREPCACFKISPLANKCHDSHETEKIVMQELMWI
jgi:hypothetical protein